MNFYPYSVPIIIDDDVFDLYGGDITLGVSNQRQAAYWVAEREVSKNLNTFLKPTIVTGTYDPAWQITLEHTYINSINSVRFIDSLGVVFFTAAGPTSDYFSLNNDGYGLLDINYLWGVCNCSVYTNYPYKIEVVYTAGLPTGTSMQPDVLLALTTYSKIIMNEIIGFGNEGPGDVGIESFNAQQYAERRRIQNTDFGSSPEAMFVNRLLKPLRRYRYVGL